MQRRWAGVVTAVLILMVSGCAGRDDTEFVWQSPRVNDQGTQAGQRACMPGPDGPSSCNR
ncbi:hypothetical protein C8D72_0801 [Kushneria indalinina DSM 14324]|uniref:Uncharacterized protein n=1 Tax=Kushneria indalinina DSM 14324 TaxID=1122140 RepID=A0A3D9DZA6_9GAMM|nr:hypothetical protein C8D72_0801 [Kushneria indalinina DSM 14324]